VIGNNKAYAVDYGPGYVRKVLDELPIPYEAYSFVDLGSGKGKVLLEAASYPFKSVEGVEFCPDLHMIAENNIRRYRGKIRCQGTVRSILGDAVDYMLPSGQVVIYLFNPFSGPVLTKVIDNIRLSANACPRNIFIICAGEWLVKDGVEALPVRALWRRKYNSVYWLPQSTIASQSLRAPIS
jgi:hypothetical protein